MTPADRARWDAAFAAISARVPHLSEAERTAVIRSMASVILDITAAPNP